MGRRILGLALTVLVMLNSTGCVGIMVAAGVGAVGGYAVSRDTFEGVTSRGQDEIWSAAERVLSIMGTVDVTDRRKGEIVAQVNGSTVSMSMVAVNLSTTKLRIKARKGIFPRIAIAQDVYTKIINQLEQ